MEERKDVGLSVPVGFDYQMVFRQEWREPLPVEERDDVEFVAVTNPLAGLKLLPAVRGQYSLSMFAKALRRLLAGNRLVTFVLKDDMIVSVTFAWIGASRHYWVEPGSAIVGGTWSSTDYRRQGIAYYGVVRTINEVIGRGHHIIYADTDRDNVGGRTIIRNVGWGEPIALYILGPKPPADGPTRGS